MYDANQLNGQLNGNGNGWHHNFDTAVLLRDETEVDSRNRHKGYPFLPVLTTAAERKSAIESAVHQILLNVGEDPERDGLQRTPHRVAKMWGEVLSGYDTDPVALVNGALFDVAYDEMVVVKEIEFHSMCEHHMLPFFGRAHVAYLPGEKVIGLSKIPRIVDMFARRLQVQERMTNEIAAMLEEMLQPRGVAVIVEGSHMCGIMRGVEKEHPRMVTTAMLGKFKNDRELRNEFMEHLRRPSGGMQ